MNSGPSENGDTHAELLAGTAKIPWRELQRFFAAGRTLILDSRLDLVEVATQIAGNSTEAVTALTTAGQLRKVPDEQALEWFEADTVVWAVVVAPWVLVQAPS